MSPLLCAFRPLPRAFLRLVAVCAVCVSLAAAARAQAVGEVFASDASIHGSVLLASSGAQVMSGSSVGAGTSPALLRLARGGEVRICAHTSVSINASSSGRDLMFSLSTGSVEAHYTLAASADSIMTPDFRIMLAGPGTFHVAILADAQGNTAIRTLANDTASLIVSELMGDGAYQVRPGDALVFHLGKVTNPDHMVPPDCGCPPPANDVARAVTPPPPQPAPTTPAPAPTPDVHVEVEAPFVFRANDPVPPPVSVARVGLGLQAPHWNLMHAAPPTAEAVLPHSDVAAPAAVAGRRRGFFGRVKAFFASVFR